VRKNARSARVIRNRPERIANPSSERTIAQLITFTNWLGDRRRAPAEMDPCGRTRPWAYFAERGFGSSFL